MTARPTTACLSRRRASLALIGRLGPVPFCHWLLPHVELSVAKQLLSGLTSRIVGSHICVGNHCGTHGPLNPNWPPEVGAAAEGGGGHRQIQLTAILNCHSHIDTQSHGNTDTHKNTHSHKYTQTHTHAHTYTHTNTHKCTKTHSGPLKIFPREVPRVISLNTLGTSLGPIFPDNP